jgi:hypothetical protein
MFDRAVRANQLTVEFERLTFPQHETAGLRGNQDETGHRKRDRNKPKELIEATHGHDSNIRPSSPSQAELNHLLTAWELERGVAAQIRSRGCCRFKGTAGLKLLRAD